MQKQQGRPSPQMCQTVAPSPQRVSTTLRRTFERAQIVDGVDRSRKHVRQYARLRPLFYSSARDMQGMKGPRR